MPDLIEKLAALEHQQWAHWMKHIVECGKWRHAGFVIDEETMDRWIAQMGTTYSSLEEHEKESDREWARKTLGVINEHLETKIST